MSTRRRITVNQIRERINLRIYDSKPFVTKLLRYFSVPLSLTAVGALIISFGFPLDEEQLALVDYILKASIGFYIFKYFSELFYDFSPPDYIRRTKSEFVLMSYMVINILAINLFNFEITSEVGNLIGVKQLDEVFMFAVQAYFLIFIALEMGKASRLLPQLKISPPALLLLSFILITILGAGLLAMPEMSTTQGGLGAMDAFFTSISAVCVTGLSTIDVSSILTFKGQVVLMFLIQLGGLNFITFTSIFALLANPGVGTRFKSMLQANYSVDSLETSVLLTGQIIRFSLLFELISAVLLFFSWGQTSFNSLGDRLFHSIFHSISAFNNAGFSLYPSGLADAALGTNVPLGLVIAGTIILGGLGFSPISEVFSYQALRYRRNRPWVHYTVNTKIAVYAVIFLVPLGTLAFYVLESGSSLRHMPEGVKWFHAFFSSVTTRTAGFNTIDFGAIGLPALLVVMLFMFIGGSSGSTAGGVKTSTFALVFLNALGTIRGRKRVELFRQTISVELLNLALSAFLFSASSILLGIFLLTITDGHLGLARIAFEEVSAFCTVGLSTGVTAQFSDAGKIVLMISMLVGRIGTVTLAFALTSKRKDSQDYRYPNASVQVG
jgi:Trk-type K+ transport system membrane component